MARQQAGTTVAVIRGGAVTIAEAADAFLSSPRVDSPNTRRAYAGVLDRLAAEVGPHRQLAAVPGDEVADALRTLWGGSAPATWNRNRAAVVSWLAWCPEEAVARPAAAARRRAAQGEQRRHPGAAPRPRRAAAVPPRRPAAGEDAVAGAVRDRRPRQRDPRPRRRGPRPRAAPRARPVQGRRHRVRLLGHRHRAPAAPAAAPARRHLARQRAAVPRRLQARPARRPAHRDICPHTGRARLGYDRARSLFNKHTGGLDLHQLRHSAATTWATRRSCS
jgi:hypothetical protein